MFFRHPVRVNLCIFYSHSLVSLTCGVNGHLGSFIAHFRFSFVCICYSISPLKATCCCMAIIVCSTGDSNLLLWHYFCSCRWWRQRVVARLFLRIPLVRATCCLAICVYHWWRQHLVAYYLCIPLVKATCCCVTVFAYTTGEGKLLLRGYLRIPLVKAMCCCVTVLHIPLVKATCCCVYHWWR